MERGSKLVTVDAERKLNKMAEFLIKNSEFCPIPSAIDMPNCVGFRKIGCSACLLENVDLLI